MQFQVPQFIEVEDKIFGPLTFKQFVYLAGGLGIAYILWRVLPFYIAVPVALGFAGLGAALAFFKYNGQPFILALEHGFFFILRSKLYLWSNVERDKVKPQQAIEIKNAVSEGDIYIPKLSDSKLHELAWSLDIKERIRSGTTSDEDRGRAQPRNDIVAPIRTARDALIR